MSRRRGRPPRQYNIRVRTVRRDQIDFEALARAALEQAAMDEREKKTSHATNRSEKPHRHPKKKEGCHDQME